MAFTAKDVAALREKTGCGMMDCKKALTASNGDMDAAIDFLREKGLAAATKKAGRIAAEGMAYAYVDGSVGVAVEVNAETDFVAKNIAMQIAAINPLYLNSSVVPAEVIEHERKIATEQAASTGKPANVIEKMVEGKIKKYFKEVCLVEQEYVKDNKMSIQQYTDSVAKELGGSIAIADYVRFEKGEGLEKREDNFADEVASMIK